MSATRKSPLRPSDIRIRAVPERQREHGHEGPFLALSHEDLVALAQIAEVIDYKTAGSEILAAGEPARFLFLLADGVIEANRPLSNGDRHIIGFYWPGDLIGLAEDGVYVNSARTLAKCTVFRFPCAALVDFFLKNPGIQHHFLVKAINDLRNAQRQIIMMGRMDITQRLATFLLDCSAHEHYFDRKTKVLTLPMSRYDIADYLGTSPEVATRAFGRLGGLELLRRRTPRTIELDTVKLETFANTGKG
jgi:CRP-like cAMP-binding protein